MDGRGGGEAQGVADPPKNVCKDGLYINSNDRTPGANLITAAATRNYTGVWISVKGAILKTIQEEEKI
jgi:hypothetical protein